MSELKPFEFLCFESKKKKGVDKFTFFLWNGYEDLAKDIFHKCNIDIHYVDNDYAFRSSCREGYIDVAKWLYSSGGDDIDKNGAFKLSCRNDKRCVRLATNIDYHK